MLEGLEQRWVPSTLTVTNIADKGVGSLRADIAMAQSGDTIDFSNSTANGAVNFYDGTVHTITLKSELLINKNLTITGPGAGQLTVSGNNNSRVFEVAQAMQATLKGLTISNGFATNGAGILVDTGAALALSNSTLSGNSASKTQRFVANFGGGIDNYGTATVSNCTLTNNTSYSGGGGGIYNHATLTVNNSVMSSNSNYGIANYGTATISGSTVSNNAGGGIYNFGVAALTVGDSTISGNSTWSGGDGGGIWNAGSATISNCTLSGNSASQFGGAIYSTTSSSPGSGTLNLTNCTVSGNYTTSTTNGEGGGIYIGDGTVTISSCSVSGNSAIIGGGIHIFGGADGGHGATVTITGSTLTGNSAQYGGGIAIDYGTVTVKDSSSITGNTAPTGHGADVYNLGVLYLDATSVIGILDGNPAIPL